MTESKKQPGTPQLDKKLAEVMAAIDRLPKRGHNDFHNYDYTTEADTVEAVRKELAARNVRLQPVVLEATVRSVGKKGHFITELRMEMQWRDGDSGEAQHIPWMGWGADAGDKGGYKAVTGAEKSFLLKTFLIPTGDDPEASSQQDRDIHTPAQQPAESGNVCVASVHESKTKTGHTRFVVYFTDGQKLSTLDERVGNLATQVQGTGEAVEYETEQRGKWTNLTALRRVATTAQEEMAQIAEQMEDEPPHPGELAAEDIPF